VQALSRSSTSSDNGSKDWAEQGTSPGQISLTKDELVWATVEICGSTVKVVSGVLVNRKSQHMRPAFACNCYDHQSCPHFGPGCHYHRSMIYDTIRDVKKFQSMQPITTHNG